MENKDYVYRVDKFMVPDGAREEFLARVKATHEVLRRQPGFLRDFLLEQSGGPGAFNIVTMAEWESQAAVEQAKEAVGALHRQLGFNPHELMARLGIHADLANYRRLGE